MITAEFVLGMCERFGCLPSQLYREDAHLLRLLELERLGGSREVADHSEYYRDPS